MDERERPGSAPGDALPGSGPVADQARPTSTAVLIANVFIYLEEGLTKMDGAVTHCVAGRCSLQQYASPSSGEHFELPTNKELASADFMVSSPFMWDVVDEAREIAMVAERVGTGKGRMSRKTISNVDGRMVMKEALMNCAEGACQTNERIYPTPHDRSGGPRQTDDSPAGQPGAGPPPTASLAASAHAHHDMLLVYSITATCDGCPPESF